MHSLNLCEQLETQENYDFDAKGRVNISEHLAKAFEKIPPTWPLKNLIAVNPLRGFESIPFKQAIEQGACYFQQEKIPEPLLIVNRETMKWCQAFFDEGQATITMPLRELGLYQSFKQLLSFEKVFSHSKEEQALFISNLPSTPEQAIVYCLTKLNLRTQHYDEFFTLLLTTLPGWASYISYKTGWSEAEENLYPVTQADYMAVRVILLYLIWPKGVALLNWFDEAKKAINNQTTHSWYQQINQNEQDYRNQLLSQLHQEIPIKNKSNQLPKAQFVFCIDVRSEPMRRAIEAQDDYETFGFAGFFGVPAKIKNHICDLNYSSCPVLLSAKHVIYEKLDGNVQLEKKLSRNKKIINMLKELYRNLKYTFTTPFTLVEIVGLWSGISMMLRTVNPILFKKLQQKLCELSPNKFPFIPVLNEFSLKGIHFEDQCFYAENFLRMINLTKNFSRAIVLCGHGAETENNAYHSALDCGACGGHDGASNARILATILNDKKVRNYLVSHSISIPDETVFIPALHNTTTDAVQLFNQNQLIDSQLFAELQLDLFSAREKNNAVRAKKLFLDGAANNFTQINLQSANWSQTRPEWGLAKNASFIIGPRAMTKKIDLEGRSFLHSYHWEEDHDGTLLTTILTAPMIVAQWINCQYLFSTLDNVAYGGGSKITQNITGKIGMIQGNGSDLMHGLPLQSVNLNEKQNYHELLRLTTIVYAPRTQLDKIISQQEILQKLFANRWVLVICIDPYDHRFYSLTPDFSWQVCSIN